MAWTLIESPTAQGSAANVSFSWSATPSQGELLVAWWNGDGTATMTSSGWTAGPTILDGNEAEMYWKIAGASESTTVQFANAAGDNHCVGGLRYSSDSIANITLDTSNSATIGNTAGSASPAAAITVGATGNLVIGYSGNHSTGGNTATSPVWSSGFTAVDDVSQSTGFTACRSFVGDNQNATAGSLSSGVTWTGTILDRQYIVMSFGPPSPYPQVAAVGGEVGTSLGSNNAQTLPAGATTGDLVLVWATNDNPSTTDLTASTGWTRLFIGTVTGNVLKHACWARLLDGGANDTLTITGAAQDYCVSSALIRNHGVTDVTTDIMVGTPATNTSGNANPPSLDAGASDKWLWLASCGVDFTTGNTISADPANYTNVDNRTSASSTSSCGQRIARRENETQTEDPGTFTNTSQEWVANTIAIKPVSAGEDVTVGTVQAVATVGSPTITVDRIATPTTVAAVATVGAPVVSVSRTATPTTVSAVASVGDPTIATGGNPAPTRVLAVATVGSPTITATAAVSPATVQAVATVGAPTVQVQVVVSPATVSAVASVGTPTRTATALLTPATVQAVVSVGLASPTAIFTIAEENALTGYASSNWEIAAENFGSTSIFGFSVEQTVQAGTTANFKVHCATAFTYKIVRLGYYGGDGARLITTGSHGGTSQSNGTQLTAGEGGTGSRICTNWSTNVTWSVPDTATPGFYLLVLDRTAGGRSHARFIVRNSNSPQADLLYIHPLSTHVAYTAFGANNDPTNGRSLYGQGANIFDQGNTRAWTCSTQRPETTRGSGANTFFAIEYPVVRFIERNGINVDYASDLDVESDTDLFTGYSAVMPVGHDEYWSQARRDAWDDYLAAGGHAFILSGNTMLWRTRWTDSNSDGRLDLMHCYKDSHTLDGQSYSGTGEDPVSWTGTWRDTRTSDGAVNDPENRSIGLWFIANGIRNDEVLVRFADKGQPIWRDCSSVQALTTGQTHQVSTDILGLEWDYIRPGHAQNPPSMRALSQSSVNLSGAAANTNGSWYTDTVNPALHNIVCFRPSGGGLVVNLGLNNWGWALDSTHDLGGASSTSTTAQQATLNVLTDMGAPPTTTMAGLTTPTDHLADWFPEVSPTTVTAVVTVGAPSVTTGTAPTPATVTAVATIGLPTRTATAAFTPATVAAVVAVGAPTVTTTAIVSPATVGVVVSIGTPARTATATLSPATVQAAVAIATPSVTGGSGGTVTPASVQAVATVGAPVVAVSRVATPATVAAVASIGAPALQVVTLVSPATVAVVVTVGLPVVQGGSGATVTPATVAAVASVGAPVITVPATVTPARVLAVVSIGTPTRLAVTQISPATVQATTTVGLPAFLATAALTALTVLARAVIGAPTVLVVGLDLPGTSTGTIEIASSSGDIVAASSTGSIE